MNETACNTEAPKAKDLDRIYSEILEADDRVNNLLSDLRGFNDRTQGCVPCEAVPITEPPCDGLLGSITEKLAKLQKSIGETGREVDRLLNIG